MKVAYWIQESDYSAADFQPVDYDAALAAVHAPDWPAKLAEFRRMEDAGGDCCPPSIGFTRPAQPVAEFLQFCPMRGGLWTIHYQHPDRKTDASLMAENATDGTVATALHAFFQADRDGVEAALERFAS